ncbi:LacI family DNA-binding transcriptional regulator [Staphylococcus xylosus]
MTNVKDVANLAQVSTATVSRVLTGLGNVKESNKEKVWGSVAKLNL